MKVEVEDINPIRKKLSVTVDADTVDEKLRESFKALAAEAEVEGFRKGKVPEQVIRQRYGKRVLDELTSRLIEETYPEAIVDKELSPTSKPEIDAGSVEEGKPFSYKAFVDVVPDIDIEGYKELKLDRKQVEVSDEEVTDALERLREGRGEYEEADEPAAGSDMVTVDFTGSIDGEAVKGGSLKGYSFVLEGGARFPEFEEAVTGKKKGEEVSFTKSFPVGYHDKAFAGKEAVFDIKVVSVKSKKLPEIDDDFAKDLGCENLDDLKTRVAEEVKKAKERGELDRLKSEAIDKLLEKNPFEVPESLINKYYSQISNSVLEGVRRGMANPRDVNLSSEEFKTRYFKLAETQAKGDIILSAIAEKEKIEVSEEEVSSAIDGLAASRSETPENIRAMLEKEGAMGVLIDGIKKEKVFDVILEEKKIVTP